MTESDVDLAELVADGGGDLGSDEMAASFALAQGDLFLEPDGWLCRGRRSHFRPVQSKRELPLFFFFCQSLRTARMIRPRMIRRWAAWRRIKKKIRCSRCDITSNTVLCNGIDTMKRNITVCDATRSKI